VDSSWAPDLGPENHTRFLNLLGVVGRVDMLWHPDLAI
jgi:hypothetical protein